MLSTNRTLTFVENRHWAKSGKLETSLYSTNFVQDTDIRLIIHYFFMIMSSLYGQTSTLNQPFCFSDDDLIACLKKSLSALAIKPKQFEKYLHLLWFSQNKLTINKYVLCKNYRSFPLYNCKQFLSQALFAFLRKTSSVERHFIVLKCVCFFLWIHEHENVNNACMLCTSILKEEKKSCVSVTF